MPTSKKQMFTFEQIAAVVNDVGNRGNALNSCSRFKMGSRIPNIVRRERHRILAKLKAIGE